MLFRCSLLSPGTTYRWTSLPTNENMAALPYPNVFRVSSSADIVPTRAAVASCGAAFHVFYELRPARSQLATWHLSTKEHEQSNRTQRSIAIAIQQRRVISRAWKQLSGLSGEVGQSKPKPQPQAPTQLRSAFHIFVRKFCHSFRSLHHRALPTNGSRSSTTKPPRPGGA